MNVKEYLKNPYRLFAVLANIGLFDWLPDIPYLKLQYKSRLNVWPNFEKPETFNEKLQWLKLYDRNPEYTRMVDKYEVKKYIQEKLGDEYIIPTLGVWEHFEDIDFEALPNRFVLKCTHDSGGLVICRDKNHLDLSAAKKKINQSLRKKYYKTCREWPYKDVPPRIIAEQYMIDKNSSEADGLTDYKFYCFNGEPCFLYISEGLENHATASISFLSLDWSFMPFYRSDYRPFDTLPRKPEKFDQMLDIARQLSQNIPFVRVDLYEINGRVYFSELTFSPCSGMIPFQPMEWDKEIGKHLVLPTTK